MEYLSARGIVHGDLAARNVLVTDDLSVKISDFGLSHLLEDREEGASLRNTHLPERWMAPEAISTQRVTPACDLWSFGIVLWEVFALGALPYRGELWLALMGLGHVIPNWSSDSERRALAVIARGKEVGGCVRTYVTTKAAVMISWRKS